MPKILRKTWDGAAAILKRVQTTGLVWKRVFRVAKPFFIDKQTRLVAAGYIAAIVALLFISAQVNVYISHALNYYMNAISGRADAVTHDTVMSMLFGWLKLIGLGGISAWPVLFLLLLAFIDPVQGVCNFLQVKLGVVWRWFLSEKYFAGYFTKLVWYKLEFNQGIDNPDQRMTDNIRDFCANSVVLFVSVVTTVTNICVWTPDLWHISPRLTIVIYVWAVVVSVVSTLIGRPMVRLNNQLNARESDLRFSLQEARREAQSIAFFNAEEVAKTQASSRLKTVVAVQIAIFKRNFLVQLFTTYANGIVPWAAPVLIAPLLMSGHVQIGAILEAQLGVASLYAALAIIVNQFQLITVYLALGERLGTLQEAIKTYADQPEAEGGIKITDGQDIIFDRLTLKSADGRSNLISDPFSLVLKKGESLCVIGDTLAETELVKLLDRLVSSGSGSLQAPPRAQMLFLTEQPYLPPMSLREAITYPCGAHCSDDEQLLKTLRLAGLEDLVALCNGLDTVQDWRLLLKLDQLQRLSLARAVFKDHDYLIIDGAMSALGDQAKEKFYDLISRQGTSIISVGQKDSLIKYHNWVLVLLGGGRWRLCKASEYEKDGGA